MKYLILTLLVLSGTASSDSAFAKGKKPWSPGPDDCKSAEAALFNWYPFCRGAVGSARYSLGKPPASDEVMANYCTCLTRVFRIQIVAEKYCSFEIPFYKLSQDQDALTHCGQIP